MELAFPLRGLGLDRFQINQYPIMQRISLYICCVVASLSWHCAAADLSYYPRLNIEHPFCPQELDLNVGNDVFYELANPLPGIKEYNMIVQHYRKKEWAHFDQKLEMFNKLYSSSPLMEAARFITAQASFERIEDYQSGDTKAAEKTLRNALYLFPKSTFIPAVTGSMASFWLAHGQYRRAIALYQSLVKQYPNHQLRCVFQAGVGESFYRMGELQKAKEQFSELDGKCANLRIGLGAIIRSADLSFQTGKFDEAIDGYKSAFRENISVVDRVFPRSFHNIGELLYRKQDYKAAKYHMESYLKLVNQHDDCVASALKRVADTAYFMNEPLKRVVGLLLAVNDTAPHTDIGKFAKAHAMLMTLPDVPLVERQRRIRFTDFLAKRIENPKIAQAVYLEKGLILLSTEDSNAVTYLNNFAKNRAYKFNKDNFLDYIQKHIQKVFSKFAKETVRGKVPESIEFFENQYHWIKDSPYENEVRDGYVNLVTAELEHRLQRSGLSWGLKILKQWKETPYWKPNELASSQRDKILFVLLKKFYKQQIDYPVDVSYPEDLLENKALVDEILAHNGRMLWNATYAQLNNKKALDSIAKDRSVASISHFPKVEQSYYWLTEGDALLDRGKPDGGIKAYAKVTAPSIVPIAQQRSAVAYIQAGNLVSSAKMVEKAYDSYSPSDRKSITNRIAKEMEKKEDWKVAPEVLKLARGDEWTAEEKAKLQHLAGRFYYEKKQCKKAIDNYQAAIKAAPQGKFIAELRYRMGKCLLDEKNKVDAIKTWRELVTMNDPFWSPMAKNELTLVDK